MKEELRISAESPRSADAVSLMDELSRCLEMITGNGGNESFDPGDVCGDKALFAVARGRDGAAVGCGALRPVDKTTAEIKRVYARRQGAGIGSALLAYLECRAAELGYETLRLETRAVNLRAVAFYESLAYRRTENYGRYVGRAYAVCFAKKLNGEGNT